jgi:lysophospholipase L1-like esterase
MTKLLGFGASTMQGAGDSQGGFFKRLEQKLAAAGKARECLNFGIGGNSTADMLTRFDAVRVHLPCPAVILLGSNDIPRDNDAWPENRLGLAAYEKNLEVMFRAFTDPQTIFVSSFLPCPRRTGLHEETFVRYMDIALKLAANAGMTIWDLYFESRHFGDKFFAEDGLHYNDAGHEHIAEHVFEMMRTWS